MDYETSPFGRFDPALLAQARKRIDDRQGHLVGACRAAMPTEIKGADDQFHLVGESLLKLHPPSLPLAQRPEPHHRDRPCVRASRPAPELAMEVATAMLYLEAAFEDLDPTRSPTRRIARRRLAERLEQVRCRRAT